MKIKIINYSIGIILSALCCSIIIYAIETNRSLIQIGIAFVSLYFPISFISSLKGKFIIFSFTSFLIIGTYICIKQQWYDTGFGVALAIVLGIATFVFRVSKVKTFDSSEYKRKQNEKRTNRQSN